MVLDGSYQAKALQLTRVAQHLLHHLAHFGRRVCKHRISTHDHVEELWVLHHRGLQAIDKTADQINGRPSETQVVQRPPSGS